MGSALMLYRAPHRRLAAPRAGQSSHAHPLLSCAPRPTPPCTPALQDIPAVAVSLDNYLARTEEQYEAAATHTVALLKALLVRKGSWSSAFGGLGFAGACVWLPTAALKGHA